MKLVKEHIKFERGIDPKDAMNTGLLVNILGKEENQGYRALILSPLKDIIKKRMNEMPIGEMIYLAKINGGLRNGEKFIVRKFDTPFEKYWGIEWDLKLEESYNFERNIDPKHAMQTGMASQFPQWNLFHLLYQESKNSENFNRVSNIDYENKEPKFVIVSKFLYGKYSGDPDDEKNWIHKQYTINLTQDEGVLLFDDNTEDEKEITSLRLFDKVTHCYES